MHLKSLYLRNFRNFTEKEFSFLPGINQIWGDNGVGKTNLLEAIYLLALGRSFRTPHLPELIRAGESALYLEAEYEYNGRSLTVTLSLQGKEKRLQIDATHYTTFQPLLGQFPLVLHTPQDGALIDSSPALRRRLLNLHLAQSDPLYVHHLTRFWRAMKQRNALLKSRNHSSITCWEAEMVPSALYLLEKRSAFISELLPPLLTYSQHLSSGTEQHKLTYQPSFTPNYQGELSKHRSREADLGLTLRGPHRDELTFSLNDRPTRLFGSEGQKKTAIAALKLAEWHRLSHSGHSPLFAIDDLGLPLDPTRQSHFYSQLSHLGQTLITSPTPLSFPSHLIHISGASPQAPPKG